MKLLKSITLIILTFAILFCFNQNFRFVTSEDSIISDTSGNKIAGTISSTTFDYISEQAMIEDMTLAADTDRYKLYYQLDSMAIAFCDKSTNTIYFSNPFNAAKDKYCIDDIKKNMESQIVLSYVDSLNKINTMWSSTDCAQLGQYSVSTLTNGVRFDMSIGEEKEEQMIPLALSAARFEIVLSKLNSRGQKRMNILYQRYSLKDIQDENERKKIIADYPLINNDDIYICLDISEREKSEIDGYFKTAGYTLDEYFTLLNEVGIKTEKKISPNFKLSIEYTLNEQGLSVNIPHESIVFNSEKFSLLSIRTLEFFGADIAEPDSDGYLFMPDGSGAIISFNGQDPNRRTVISGRVYGKDIATTQTVKEREGKQIYLPVFGVRRNNKSALFSIITSGDEMSQITSKLGEPNSSYYSIYNTFLYTENEYTTIDAKISSIGSSNTVLLYNPKFYDRNFTMQFYPLSGDEADYMGMAKTYNSYLHDIGMSKNTNSNLVYLGLETLGTSLYKASIFGFQYNTDAQYTSFDQSKQIAIYFQENSIRNINLNLNGWRKDGLDAGVANKVSVSKALGGKNGLLDLSKWALENDVAVYPDTDMLFVHNDGFLDGFMNMFDSARMLNRQYAGLGDFKADIYKFRDLSPAISPDKYKLYWKSFFKDYETLKQIGISLGSVGEYLISDFNSSNLYHRGDSLGEIKDLLANYSKNYKTSFDGANAYVLPYATMIKNVPLSNSGFNGETYAIPFLQLAISGSVIYHSSPINLDEDIQAALLGCIESRTSPYFILAADNVERLKSTKYTKYYSVDFAVLKENIVEYYNYVQTALALVENEEIIDHKILASGVSCTTYENDVNIYVNYNKNNYSENGITVLAESYSVVTR